MIIVALAVVILAVALIYFIRRKHENYSINNYSVDCSDMIEKVKTRLCASNDAPPNCKSLLDNIDFTPICTATEKQSNAYIKKNGSYNGETGQNGFNSYFKDTFVIGVIGAVSGSGVTKVVNNFKDATSCINNYKATDSRYNQCINKIT